MIEHEFTPTIREILKRRFKKDADDVFNGSPLLQYLNQKTISAHRGSKARSSFGNIYAIYVLVEDYIANGFTKSGDYRKYAGAKFSDLFSRQRELPFGSKLQNHSLNSRANEEFRKYFKTLNKFPIARDQESSRYWINEGLLQVSIGRKVLNVAEALIEIIDSYVAAKRTAFDAFVENCRDIQRAKDAGGERGIRFVEGLLQPNVDARIFEIVSYAILKEKYSETKIYWGWSPDQMKEQFLELFKTGRTNANDGGIDFVMRPLGRFFQVTETTDVKKYFLDIDKVRRYPITFVVKTEASSADLLAAMRVQANAQYGVDAVVERFMSSIEEVINIPRLLDDLRAVIGAGKFGKVLDEVVLQSSIEFNYELAVEDGEGANA